jgi:LPS-assembly protein
LPQSNRFSDVLLLAATKLIPSWTLEGSTQYSPDQRSLAQILVGGRYSPSAFRTVNFNYRETVDHTRQVEMGWQWPLFGPTPPEFERPRNAAAPRSNSGGCRGSLYTVGRALYNVSESRVTNAVVGFEYDAGCWIGRLVVERVSTGVSTARTTPMLQIELVGLSSLGANPLQVLKDNIPGYQLLNDTRSAPAPLLPYE